MSLPFLAFLMSVSISLYVLGGLNCMLGIGEKTYFVGLDPRRSILGYGVVGFLDARHDEW